MREKIKTKFKIGDTVKCCLKGSVYEGFWFDIVNRKIRRCNGKIVSIEYRLTDGCFTFWAFEKDLKLIHIKSLKDAGEKL